MLASAGLGWGDITPVPLGMSNGAAAFSSGALDAWAIYGFHGFDPVHDLRL